MLNEPFRILFVCVGNICRSPLAERLLQVKLADAGVAASYDVSSAGVHGLVGRPIDDRAADQLVALGGDPTGFAARRLTNELVGQANLVLTATTGVRREVLEEAPGALHRTFTLIEFAHLVAAVPSPGGTPPALVADAAARRGTLGALDLDVPDPMGQSVQTHAAAAEVAAVAVEQIARALASVVE